MLALQTVHPILGELGHEAFLNFQTGTLVQWSDNAWGIQSETELLGVFCFDQAHALDRLAQEAYAKIFQLCRGKHIYRFWNFIRDINENGSNGIENYQNFCIGRSSAFAEYFQGSFQKHMPAASAVGIPDDTLVVVFWAGDAAPLYVENPNQIPAYLYPEAYSPLPPSFARATVCPEPSSGKSRFLISGTASISGHESLYRGDIARQLQLTLENIELIYAECAKQNNIASSSHCSDVRVYLRNAEDFECVQKHLEACWQNVAERFVYVQADICRSELLLEIEKTVQFY